MTQEIREVAKDLSARWEDLTGKLPTLAAYPLERACNKYDLEQLRRGLVWFLSPKNKNIVIAESRKMGCQKETKEEYKPLYFDFSYHFLPLTLLDRWVELSAKKGGRDGV